MNEETTPKKKYIFEPMTTKQEFCINRLVNDKVTPTLDEIEEKLKKLIHVPWIDALSKQEAIFFIDCLKGKEKSKSPALPRTIDIMPESARALPSYGMIYRIREQVGLKVGSGKWSRADFSDWLEGKVGVRRINDLDREKTVIVYKALCHAPTRDAFTGRSLKHVLS